MKSFLWAALCAAGLCMGADIERSTSLEEGYRQMYNLQFDEAHRTFHQWENAHPADPLGPVSDAAAFLFSEFDRLHILQSEFFAEDENFLRMHKLTPDLAVKSGFEADLNSTNQLAGGDATTNPDAGFAQVLQHGLHSDYLALIEKRYVAALGETKLARAAAEKVLTSHPDYYDANLAGADTPLAAGNRLGDRQAGWHRKAASHCGKGSLSGSVRKTAAGGGGAARQRPQRCAGTAKLARGALSGKSSVPIRISQGPIECATAFRRPRAQRSPARRDIETIWDETFPRRALCAYENRQRCQRPPASLLQAIGIAAGFQGLLGQQT